jgi:hypothetical protein
VLQKGKQFLFHQWFIIRNTCMKVVFRSTTISGVSPERKHTPYASAAGMLLQINGKLTIGKLKSSLLS